MLKNGSNFNNARSDIMEKIIKNCRGLKQCNGEINRAEKENQRKKFRSLLGFKEYQSKEYSITLKIQKVF